MRKNREKKFQKIPKNSRNLFGAIGVCQSQEIIRARILRCSKLGAKGEWFYPKSLI